MEGQTIVLLIVVFVLGAAISWFLTRRGVKSQSGETLKNLADQEAKHNQEISELKVKINTLGEENKLLKEDNDNLKTESEKQLAESVKKVQETEASLKRQYDNLLNQIKEENTRLDSQLKLATEGKVDDVVQEKLANAALAENKVKDIEAQLSELHQKHESLLSEHQPLKDDLEKAKAECQALDKKVKKLADDLEEAEDEQDELRDEISKKKRELQASKEELDEAERAKSKLKKELEDRERELSEKVNELKLKGNSIKFIQDILTARPSSQEDIKKIYKNIDFFESFIKGQYLDCLSYISNTYPDVIQMEGKNGREGYEILKKLILQKFDEWSSVKRKSWLDKKTTIAFVGEFSAGKTSIVNRILSQDDPNIPKLPVSSKATTAIPTYIAGGPSETYSFVTPDDQLKDINEEIFKKVSKEVLDEVKGVSSLIKYFVMTYKNPNLQGLSVLDTPGFNSNDAEDKERTIEVINECDALFWVFDVNAGTVNRSSIALIKEKLNKPLFVVINKIDTKPKSEVDKVESLIRKTLTDAGLKVEKFIRFSSKAPLGDIMTPIHSVSRDKTRDSFVEDIDEDLKDLLNHISNGVKEFENNLNDCEKKVLGITDKFNNGMNDLWNACNEAAGIPHWEEHFFSSDRYEMSAEEGSHLINLLEEIATNRANHLADVYNEEMQAIAEQQQAYSDLVDLKATWQKIDDCITEFKKISRKLKQQ
ncbi:hypothetical protein HDR70_03460 [bacterium]|nr:hypothetical protein [bacterium]